MEDVALARRFVTRLGRTTGQPLEDAAAADPKSVFALFDLGRLLVWRGLSQEAIPHLEAAARLHPGSPEILLELGRAHDAAGDSGSAEDAYRKWRAEVEADAPQADGLTFEAAVDKARAFLARQGWSELFLQVEDGRHGWRFVFTQGAARVHLFIDDTGEIHGMRAEVAGDGKGKD